MLKAESGELRPRKLYPGAVPLQLVPNEHCQLSSVTFLKHCAP